MDKKIFVFVLKPYQISSSEHIEHFDPHAKKWRKCESTSENLCPFVLLPHKLAYEGMSCSCGKTMEEFLKILGEIISREPAE